MSRMKRRTFVQGSMATAALLTPTMRVMGANSEVRVVICGVGGKGNHHKKMFTKSVKGARLVGFCDADEAHVGGKDPAKGRHTDPREVLDRKDVDAIVIATPNHWHSLLTIWGCQAGKHVYVEKPISHNIFEGRKAAEAARKYKRVVQVGTQSRSARNWQQLAADIEAGKWGKVKVSRGFCYKRRGSIGKVDGPQKPPSSVDFSLYQGPAPLAPLMRKRFHYDWHWQWNTGNGDIGNQGIHQVDIARWMAGHEAGPTRVISYGGRFDYDDDGQTPNTQSVVLEFAQGPPIVFEVRGLGDKKGGRNMPHYKGVRVGNIVEFEDGRWSNGGRVYDAKGGVIHKYDGGGAEKHQQNFIDAVHAGDPGKLNAESMKGHLSAVLFHLGNISHRLGAAATTEELQKLGGGKDLRAEIADRFLKDASIHEENFKSRHATVGLDLKFDPATEKFVDNDKANAMVARPYRKPYVVPETV
jgi:predicted dehydrogenase